MSRIPKHAVSLTHSWTKHSAAPAAFLLAAVLVVTAAHGEESPSANDSSPRESAEQTQPTLSELEALECQLVERFTEEHPRLAFVRAEIQELKEGLGRSAAAPHSQPMPPSLPQVSEVLPTPTPPVETPDITPTEQPKSAPQITPAVEPAEPQPKSDGTETKQPRTGGQIDAKLQSTPSVTSSAVGSIPATGLPLVPVLTWGFLAVLLGGAGTVFLKSRRNPVLKTAAQLQRHLGLPVVGPIPYENPQVA